MDKQFEFLSFPTIYCGNTRVDNHLIISKQRSHELTIVFFWFLFLAQPTFRVLSTFAFFPLSESLEQDTLILALGAAIFFDLRLR